MIWGPGLQNWEGISGCGFEPRVVVTMALALVLWLLTPLVRRGHLQCDRCRDPAKMNPGRGQEDRQPHLLWGSSGQTPRGKGLRVDPPGGSAEKGEKGAGRHLGQLVYEVLLLHNLEFQEVNFSLILTLIQVV